MHMMVESLIVWWGPEYLSGLSEIVQVVSGEAY